MKVILKENVLNVGEMGDLVSVSGGYARNFLIPRKLAVAATNSNVRVLEHEKRLIEKKKAKVRGVAEELAQKVRDIPITISVQAGEEKSDEEVKIFGSVTSKDVVEALAKGGVEVDKRNVLLAHPIKELGTFQVPVKLHSDVTVEVSVSVVRSS